MTHPAPQGFRRPDGRFGVRNHLLVLPSVVCATQVVRELAGDEQIALVHQHGCLHVGDDLHHTERELTGVATNPNVGAVLVVSLGCETLRGKRLAAAIAERGQTVKLVGIQAAGGSAAAAARGRGILRRLRDQLDAQHPEPLPPGELRLGIDACADDRVAVELGQALAARGVRMEQAPDGLSGAEAHVALAGRGVQLILNLPGPADAPIGFAATPVISIGRDFELHHALADDFDLLLDLRPPDSPAQAAERILRAVFAHAAGEPTAAERRGARDFVLHRLAMTM